MVRLNGVFTALCLIFYPAVLPLEYKKDFPNHHTTEYEHSLVLLDDTTVNYCTLVRSAFFYGEKSTENTPSLSENDVKYFNDNWKQVFNIEFYQTGITSTEFSAWRSPAIVSRFVRETKIYSAVH